ncbi:hypothetical protein, partial [Polyangium spumosum]|uniref:hypothetical protein n=1 Tax=Polyangium spumosum TaxID=889282 RepID=UPI001981CCB6
TTSEERSPKQKPAPRRRADIPPPLHQSSRENVASLQDSVRVDNLSPGALLEPAERLKLKIQG